MGSIRKLGYVTASLLDLKQESGTWPSRVASFRGAIQYWSSEHHAFLPSLIAIHFVYGQGRNSEGGL